MQPQYFNGGGQRITPMAPAATYSSQDSSLGAEHPGNFTAMSHDMTAKTTSPNPLPAGYGASMVGVNPAPPLGLSMMGMPGPFSIASPAIFDGQGAMLAPAERQNYPKPADPMSTASRNSRVESQNSSSRSYSSNIYVASLPENFSDADLMNLAAPYGEIISAKAMCRRGTKICKGYGFVLFKHEEDAAKAQAALMGQIVGGNKIQVRRARVSASAPLMESSVIKPDTSRSTMSGNSSIASGAAVMVNANDIPYGLQAVAPPANTMGGAPPGTCCYMPMQSPSMPLGMWPAPAPQSFVEDPRVQPQPQPVMYFMVPMPNPTL